MKYFLYFSFFLLFNILFCYFLLRLDINKRVYNHVPGECSIIPNLSGAIDFVTTNNGLLFLTVKPMTNTPSFGHLFSFNADNKTAKELSFQQISYRWKPTTMSIYDGKRNTFLFLYDEEKSIIMKFELNNNEDKLIFMKKFPEKFYNVQSISAVGYNSFFLIKKQIENYKYFSAIAKILPIPLEVLYFYDGKSLNSVASISNPTDLVFDSFKRHLYISSFAKNTITTIRVKNNNDLVFIREDDIGCAPTSMWKDIEGSLLVTCHQVRLRYFLNFFNNNFSSPSMILRVLIPTAKEKGVTINQLYSNDGATISNANNAVRTGRSLLLSNGERILSCVI